MVERYGLRAVHRHGHMAELLFTFGLAFVIGEVVPLIWGRNPVPYRVPAALDFPLFHVGGTDYPAYRVFMMAVSLACSWRCSPPCRAPGWAWSCARR